MVPEGMDQAQGFGPPPSDSEFASAGGGQPEPVQSESPTVEPVAKAEAPAATVAVPGEYEIDGKKWKVDDLRQSIEIATNPQKFVASATQKAQEAARLREEAASLRQQWESERQAFMSDPLNREVMEARRLLDNDPNAYARLQQALAAMQGRPTQDALAARALQEIRVLKDRAMREDYERQQQYQKELETEVGKHVDEFAKNHPELTDSQMEKFTDWYAGRPDIVNVEDAYRVYNFDALIAKAKQDALDEAAKVEVQKREAAGVIPTAHTKVEFRPDARDADFEKAREASLRSGIFS